jgi:hypothetical protein
VNHVAPLPAVLSALVLFFVPGLVLVALLPRQVQERLSWDEALFAVVSLSILPSALLALVLAEGGWFSLPVAAGCLLVGSALGALLFRRRLLLVVPPPRARRLVPFLAVLGLALALDARPTEDLVGGRDPGAYIAAMCVIGRTGGIVYRDPAVLAIPESDRDVFFRNPGAPRDFSWARFMGFPLERPETGRVVPEFFHLFPSFGAYLFEAMGVKGALGTPPLFGVMGTLAVFVALRRILGGAAALVATVLFATNPVLVWFSRYPVSETLSLFLLFTGLFFLALFEETPHPLLGVFAGTALGMGLLVRIDAVLLALPLACYAVLRRRGRLSLLLPFAVLAIHSGVHALFWSRKYVLDIMSRSYWRHSPPFWVAAGVVALAGVVLVDRLAPRLVASVAGPGLRRGIAVALLLLAAYAYFLRPQLSAWAGADGNDPARAWITPRALVPEKNTEREGGGDPLHRMHRRSDSKAMLARLPPLPRLLVRLGFRRLAAHDAQALFRLGWFVSRLGLLLGVLGVLVMIDRYQPPYLFFLLTSVVFSLFYLYKIRVYNDYFFALRRFVPATLPALFAGMAVLLVALWRRGRLGKLASLGLLGFLLAFNVSGLVRGFGQKRDLLRFVDWKSTVSFVYDLARRFGPRDVVVFEQPRSIHLLSLPLWAAYDVQILQLARFDPDPVRLDHAIRSFRSRYENVYFVHTYSTDLCGLFLDRVSEESFGTYEWERTYDRPPTAPEARSFHFTISRVVLPEELRVPPLREIDIGGSDDEVVSGFFGKEADGDRSVRWTGGCASVFLPAAAPGATVTITASANRRPDAAPVTASFAGVPLGTKSVGPGWEELSFVLPGSLPPGPPVLRLDVPPWRPARSLPLSSDTRDLGVMVDRIRVEPRKDAASR